jgi:hypothetical protein
MIKIVKWFFGGYRMINTSFALFILSLFLFLIACTNFIALFKIKHEIHHLNRDIMLIDKDVLKSENKLSLLDYELNKMMSTENLLAIVKSENSYKYISNNRIITD